MPQRLTALLVLHNAEALLPECLASVAFADEIVAVLDRCTDGTKALCEAAGAKLVEGAWPLEGPRRNAGLAVCTGDWVLEVDADERVPPELAAEIRATIETAKKGAILIPFDNRIGGVPVAHGWGAYNGVGAKRCLFAAGTKHWGEQRLHPSLKQAELVATLQARMIHHVYRDFPDMYARLLKYSALAAQDMVEEGKVPKPLKTFRRFFTRYWKSYVSRKGHREGFYGVALGVFSGMYPVLSHLMALELKRKRPSQGAITGTLGK
jgi:glycosyltransferase involved in cell wall biosynthesis